MRYLTAMGCAAAFFPSLTNVARHSESSIIYSKWAIMTRGIRTFQKTAMLIALRAIFCRWIPLSIDIDVLRTNHNTFYSSPTTASWEHNTIARHYPVRDLISIETYANQFSTPSFGGGWGEVHIARRAFKLNTKFQKPQGRFLPSVEMTPFT